MYDYGESCPISKATSLLCERWTLQIIREMFLGARRFSEFQKYLPKLSPSLLNARLRFLVDNGIAIRKRIAEKRGYEYHLTAAGKSLAPVLTEMGRWGSHWVHDMASSEEQDIESLLRGVANAIDSEQLPGGDTIIQFDFSDAAEPSRWYITIKNGQAEICDHNPGHEVDVYIRSTFKTLHAVWWGDITLASARENGSIHVNGEAAYTRRMASWFPTGGFLNCSNPALQVPDLKIGTNPSKTFRTPRRAPGNRSPAGD